jgi:DNA repair exonuclease SbcCD ATPase subunit
VDGEEHGASSAQSPGEPVRDLREDLGSSGWTTTKQAAKVLGVSRRSVQGYVGRGLLEAHEEGEGVNRRFLISIDSLNTLVDRRRREAEETANFVEASPQSEETATPFANTGEGLRRLIERLEARTAEATELRLRLELTEKAQSTLEEELDGERRRREETEAERDALRRELHEWHRLEETAESTAHEIHDRLADERSHEATPSEPSESPESPGTSDAPPDAGGEAQEATERQEERKGWLRRFFGL